MKAKLLILFVLWGACGVTELLACGNKFLVPSRGTRFGKVAIDRQEAAILVYATPASGVARAMGDIPVETVLVQAGYMPSAVPDLDSDSMHRGLIAYKKGGEAPSEAEVLCDLANLSQERQVRQRSRCCCVTTASGSFWGSMFSRNLWSKHWRTWNSGSRSTSPAWSKSPSSATP